jgi:hypothetical protein
MQDNSSVAGTLKHFLVGSQSVLCFPGAAVAANESYLPEFWGLKDVVGNMISSQTTFF